MIRHECGLLGIYGHEEAARLTYFGLYAQQHRGQESAGIVTIDEKGLLHEHKGMGLVPDVFAEANLQALPGTISLGHVRYSTTGRSAARNAQPFVAHYKGLDIAIAHNGNLVNTMELREELENDGAIFSTTNDTEVFMHLIVRALREHDLVDAIREACARVRGAYCLLVYAGGTMVAVRDPHGFHPLALGRLDGAPVLDQTFNFQYSGVNIDGDLILLYNDSGCQVFNLNGVQKFTGSFDFTVSKVSAGRFPGTLLVTGPQMMKEIRLQ